MAKQKTVYHYVYRVNAIVECLEDGVTRIWNYAVLTTNKKRVIPVARKVLAEQPYTKYFILRKVESPRDCRMYWSDQSLDLLVDEEIYNIVKHNKRKKRRANEFIEKAFNLMKSRKEGYLNKAEVYKAVTGKDYLSSVCPRDYPQVKIDKEDQEKAIQIIRAFGRPMKELPIYLDWKREHGDWPNDTNYYFEHIDQIECDFSNGIDISSSVEGLIDAMLED